MINKKLTTLSRNNKRLLVIVNDVIIIFLSLTFSIYSYFETISNPWLVFSFPIIAVLFFNFFKIYNNVIKHISFESTIKINITLLLLHLAFYLINNFLSEIQIPVQVVINSFFSSAFLIYFSRVVARYILYKNKYVNIMEDVAIFLNKNDNEEIINIINDNDIFNIAAIISADKDYEGMYMKGFKVYPKSDLEKIINSKKIKKLFIHSKAYDKGIRADIYSIISKFPLKIVEIPDIEEIVSGKDDLNILKNLSIEDIVDRTLKNKIEIDVNFFKSKNVLVTGGGGSIGSVLCEEILNNHPSKLIIIDNSEYSLFKILEKLKNKNTEVNIEGRLLDLKDKHLLDNFFKKNKVDIIYHAAAYKHVGLVENNVESGIKNNITGFINLLESASSNNVKNIILVSTDKAVSPTTVMGMTKRVCEMVLFNELTKNDSLNFSAVRFGNVFNSSGSVISIFKRQIQKGKDLTLTDKDVTRYFMSIKEAANLVIKSSTISKGGELFILDMGEPIKILDVAKKMIHLSGKTIKSDNNPDGDIAIKITGLLPSEKVHEELSETELSITADNKIFQSKDLPSKSTDFEIKLNDLLNSKDEKNELLKKLKDLAIN